MAEIGASVVAELVALTIPGIAIYLTFLPNLYSKIDQDKWETEKTLFIQSNRLVPASIGLAVGSFAVFGGSGLVLMAVAIGAIPGFVAEFTVALGYIALVGSLFLVILVLWREYLENNNGIHMYIQEGG